MKKGKIIAETGAAHRKSYSRCLALISSASAAGAGAVKFSAFKAGEMTVKSDESPFVIGAGFSLISLVAVQLITGQVRQASRAPVQSK